MYEYFLFNEKPAWNEADEVTQKALLLAQRQYKAWTVTLYMLGNHFIEVWEKEGVKVSTSFQKSARALYILEPYTDAIDVAQLLA